MRLPVVPVAAALFFSVALAAPASAQLPTRYVALGDSVGAGSAAGSQGYVWLHHEYLRGSDPDLQLINQSVGGEDSVTLRQDVASSGPGSGQLRKALASIDDAGTDTTDVTIDIGGNDGRNGCNADTWFSDAACPFGQSFAATLDDLNGALADDPGEEDLVVIAYYNPAAGYDLAAQQAYDRGLLGTDLRIDCGATGTALGLNDRIACIGQAKGAIVADAYPGSCAGGDYMSSDRIHPAVAGHAAIAEAIRNPPPLAQEPCATPPTPTTNRAPLCGDLVVQLDAGGSATIPEGCVDPDGDELTVSLVAAPVHGALGGGGPYTYTAHAGFVGADELRYRATDGYGAQSEVAKVTFLAGDPDTNQAPVCPALVVRVPQGGSAQLSGQCRDVDGNQLTYGLVGYSQNGSLSISGPSSVVYTPNPTFAGVDTLRYSATDNLSPVVESVTRLVVPGVNTPNSAPRCPDIKLATKPGQTLPLHGMCTDPDGGQLSYAIVDPPTVGSIGGPVGGSLASYVPPPGFTGVATFTYRAQDPGQLWSPVATVRVAVGDDVAQLDAGGSLASAGASLTSPVGGLAAIVPKPAGDLEGYELLGSAYEIVAPDATPADPLVIEFRVPAEGVVAEELVVMRNGAEVAPCSAPEIAEPDPCAEEPVPDGTDLVIRVRTSRASVWHVAVPATTMTLHEPLDRRVANVVRGGRVVPVKVETFVGATELRDPAPTLGAAVPVDCPAAGDAVEQVVDDGDGSGGAAFRRDGDGDRWIYNLDTSGLARGGCYRYAIRSAGERVGGFTLQVR